VRGDIPIAPADHPQRERGEVVGDLLWCPGQVVPVPPGDVDGERQQGHGRHARAGRVKLAAGDASLDDVQHQPVYGLPDRQDLLLMLGTEGAELVVQDARGRVVPSVVANECLHHRGQPLGRICGRRRGVRDDLKRNLMAMQRDSVQQLFLGAVMDVQARRAHPRGARDGTRGSAVKSVLGETLDSGGGEPALRVRAGTVGRLWIGGAAIARLSSDRR